MEVVSPIETAYIYGTSPSKVMLCLCTLNCGVLFFDLTEDLNSCNPTIDLELYHLKYQIRCYYKKCIPSPNGQTTACLTGLNNTVYIYDLISQDQDFTAISTYPDCCDQIVWSSDSSILLCYMKSNPTSLYFVHPFTKTSQRVRLIDTKHDMICVGSHY